MKYPFRFASTPSAGPPRPAAAPAAAAPQPKARQPVYRLEMRDLSHPGSQVFLRSVDSSTVLRDSVRRIHELLYAGGRVSSSAPAAAAASEPSSSSSKPVPATPTHTHTTAPATRSVTLIVRPLPGVAYTTGSELDGDHKEIHLSAEYVSRIAPPARREAELRGVLLHELVHCWQWDGRGTAPGGLIEGVADWVRLRCGLAPPHWKRGEGVAKGAWDAGYQHTAFFLDWVEERFGKGSIAALNARLRDSVYEEEAFWTGLFGQSVSALWKEYQTTFAS